MRVTDRYCRECHEPTRRLANGSCATCGAPPYEVPYEVRVIADAFRGHAGRPWDAEVVL
jgi:hypothetical protein